MKKILSIVAIAAIMASCNDDKKTDATETTTDSVTMDANQMSNMADSANKMMDKMGDSANKMMDKMGDSASKMLNKMADSIKK